MAAPVYATPEQYAASPYGRAEADGADLVAGLAVASRDVDDLLITACYDVDEDDMPTDTDVAEAIREATIAQCSYGIDPSADLADGQLPAGVASVSAGSISISVAKPAAEIRVRGVVYSPRAWSLLRGAGLTGREPRTP
jgi:hypothetical protein